MNRNTLVSVTALLLWLAACASNPPPHEPQRPAVIAPSVGERFAKIVDDYIDITFAFSPTSGTEAGLHQYDNRIEDRSRAAYEGYIASLHGLLSRLDSIDRKALHFDDRIDAQALDADIRASLFELETIKSWQHNPMRYAGLPGGAAGALVKRDFAPGPQRLRSVIARLNGVPAIYRACMSNVRNPPKEFTDLAIRMSGGSVGYFEGTLATWARETAGTDSALLEEFNAANSVAIESTRQFAQWLKDDLLPRSKGAYAIGAENFLTKMRLEEMVDMPLADLLAKGEAQLEKDYQSFLATARQIDPTKTPAEVMASLSNDHPTADDLIPSVRRTIDEARLFSADHGIVTIPSEVRPRIEETPPYARSGSFASMDTPGAFETKATEAFYYVTPVETEWDDKHKEEHLRLYNPYVVAMINVHEAYPGHYLQFLWGPKFPTKLRKILGCGTNAEGWAHYCEQMMWEAGFGGNDPKYHLAQLQEALLRDCRYVAGIKLHTEGWTVERAAELFVEKGFQEPANAFEEARRGTYNPTYLYYTLGKIQIYELRDEYMKEKGATMKEFHDAFVSQGALPIPLVRQILFR